LGCVTAMRQDRRATCYTLAIQEHRSLEIDIADKREMRAGEMIGNMGPQSTPVNFLMGSLDPLSMEPCGLMWDESGAQLGAQLAGWAGHEAQPRHRCRGAALRGMPNRHGIKNRLHVSGPVSWPDARVSEHRGMTPCCHPLPPCDGVVVASPFRGGH